MGKKIKIGLDDYERREGGYNGEVPKGTVDGKLVSLKEHTSGQGNEGLEWIFECTDERFAGWRGWVYSNTDSTMWKTQQIVDALSNGAGMEIDVIDEDEDGSSSKTVKQGLPVRLRVQHEDYEGETRGRIRVVMPHPDAASVKKAKKKSKDDSPV